MKKSKLKKDSTPAAKIKNDISPSKSSEAVDVFFTRHGFKIFLFLLFFILFAVFYDFIVLKKIYLFKDIGSDSINIYYPYWVYISDYLRTGGIPQWSHQVGMGQNIFLFGLDFFSLLLYAVGRNGIPYAIAFVEMVKILLSGIFIYYYVRSFNTSKYVATIGALVYAFCGYIILGGCGWYTQSTEVFLAAFFLLSAEKFLKNKWYWLPVAACFIGLNNAYFLFPYGVLLIIYLSVRFIDEKGFSLKKITAFLFYAGMCFLLGALMSSFSVISTALIIYNSPRVSGDASGFAQLSSAPILDIARPVEYISFILRMFSNDLAGNGNNYRGWGNYLEGPVLYIGLPSLLIFSQFFHGLSKHRKKLYITCSLFVLLVIVFPYFRYLFWGFGLDYFRTFSFFISLFIFYMAIRSLNNIFNKNIPVNLLTLAITLAACLILLYFNNPVKEEIENKNLRDIIALFLIGYAVLLLLFRFRVYRPVLKMIFVILLCLELIFCSNTTISGRDVMNADELRSGTGYNDYTVDQLKYLRENEKDPFYRITKNYFSGPAMHASLNDALVQGYRSTPAYSSFNQKYYIKFLQAINVVKEGNANDIKWAMGVSNRPLLQSLVSNKYVLQKTKAGDLDTLGFRKIKTFGDVDLYRSRTYIPFGITFSRVILSSDFKKMSDLNKDVSLLRGFVIDDTMATRYADFDRLLLSDTLSGLSWNDFYRLADSLKTDSFLISSLSDNHIKGRLRVSRNKLLLLSIPYDEGWKLKVNGKPQATELADYGLLGVRVDKGENTVSLDYAPPYKNSGFLLSAIFIFIFVILFFFFRKKTLVKI